MSKTTITVPIAEYASDGTSRYSQPQNTKWRNQPQSIAVAAGGIIFMSAGMHMAQGVGWYRGLGNFNDHLQFSWFIGVIIGVVLAAPLANIIPKKIMLGFSSLLILIEGIIFASAPYEYDALLAGRYLNGIAAGLTIIPFFIHASEIAVNSYRGTCLAIEQYGVSFGIAIQVIYISQWGSTSFAANRLQGILDIIFSLAAAGFLYYFIESPIYYIRKGDEAAALDSLSRLQRPQGVTLATNAQLEESKNYVRENENLTLLDSVKRGFFPLVNMIFFRSMMVAFSFSLPLTIALQFSVAINGTTWAPIVSACLRTFGTFIALSIVDGLGRKLPSLISAVVMGALMIAIATMFGVNFNIFTLNNMATIISLSLLTQFFAGLFVPFTSVYMGEAFPLTVKPYFMGLCVIIEQLIHIIMLFTITVFPNDIYDCLLAQGILIVVMCVYLCATMPETRNTSLKEAQDRFRQLLHLKLF